MIIVINRWDIDTMGVGTVLAYHAFHLEFKFQTENFEFYG